MSEANPASLPTNLTDATLRDRAFVLAAELKAYGRRMATAESCTGGWIAKVCTDLAGSSRWIECGWVTYSNDAKIHQIGVRPATLAQFGAVSEMTAAEMALGALKTSGADYALSVTGVAGPGGGSPDKPVGTVCFGWVGPDQQPETETRHFRFDVDEDRIRECIRRATIAYSLDGLLARIG
ncbi:MAG: nicotinamide-nucleotide amidohydrolase family protein [Pseudomonadota bacterium]